MPRKAKSLILRKQSRNAAPDVDARRFMANVTIAWLDEEQTIIRTHFGDPLASWSQHEAAGERVIALARTVSHPVYIVTTFGPNFKGPPFNTGNPFRSFEKFMGNLPPNVVFVTNVGMHIVEHFLVSMFMRIHPRIQVKAHHADTLDEALALIRKHKTQSTGA
jgi:hypothetical protein